MGPLRSCHAQPGQVSDCRVESNVAVCLQPVPLASFGRTEQNIRVVSPAHRAGVKRKVAMVDPTIATVMSYQSRKGYDLGTQAVLRTRLGTLGRH